MAKNRTAPRLATSRKTAGKRASRRSHIISECLRTAVKPEEEDLIRDFKNLRIDDGRSGHVKNKVKEVKEIVRTERRKLEATQRSIRDGCHLDEIIDSHLTESMERLSLQGSMRIRRKLLRDFTNKLKLQRRSQIDSRAGHEYRLVTLKKIKLSDHIAKYDKKQKRGFIYRPGLCPAGVQKPIAAASATTSDESIQKYIPASGKRKEKQEIVLSVRDGPVQSSHPLDQARVEKPSEESLSCRFAG